MNKRFRLTNDKSVRLPTPLEALAAVMRAEVVASPGVIRLSEHQICACCGRPVGEEARSKRNLNPTTA